MQTAIQIHLNRELWAHKNNMSDFRIDPMDFSTDRIHNLLSQVHTLTQRIDELESEIKQMKEAQQGESSTDLMVEYCHG